MNKLFATKKYLPHLQFIIFDGSNYKECSTFIGIDNVDTRLNYLNAITLAGVVKVNNGNVIVKQESCGVSFFEVWERVKFDEAHTIYALY